MSDINLVGKRTTELANTEKRIKTLKLAAIVSLVVVAFLAVIIFVIQSQLSLANLQKDKNYTLNSISFLHTKSAKLITINSRTTDIANILKKRKDYSKLMNKMLAAIPTDLSINNFELDKNEVMVTVSGSNLKSIDQMINGLLQIVKKDKLLSALTINSLSVSNNSGIYSFSISAKLL